MKSALRRLRNATPVPMNQGGLYRFSSLTLPAAGMETFMRAYQTSGVVHAVIDLLANSTARPEWHLYKSQPRDGRVRYTTNDNPSDQRTEVVNHAALTLLNTPNPFQTRFAFFELTQKYLDLTGEAYWVLNRDNALKQPTGIWAVRPDLMEPVPDVDNYLAGWIYTAPDGRTKIPLPVDMVIQIVNTDPLNPLRGIGAIQAVLREIDSDRYAGEWNRNFFLNSARPDGVITVPGTWDDTEFNNFENRWRETHRGVNRAHSVALLEQGATWQAMSPTAKDMDFVNLMNTYQDRIRAALRIHKVMIGQSDDVNRANAQTGEEIFSAWEVVPRLDRLKDAINFRLLPMFGAAGIEFDYVTPVPTNREQDMQELQTKASAASYLVNAGFEPHDVLKAVGLPDMEVLEKASPIPAVPPGWVVPKSSDPASPQPAAPAPAAPAAGDVANAMALMREMALFNKARM